MCETVMIDMDANLYYTDSMVKCKPLINIPYGHVHYEITDTTVIRPGDVVTYSCDPPYILEGSEYRICMSNGTWSEEAPQCAGETSCFDVS